MKRPQVQFDHAIPDLPFSVELLSNGIPVHTIHAGETEVIRLDVIIDAGRFKEASKTVSYATGRLLKEGTRSFNSRQIAEKVDFLGAELRTGASLDVIYLTLSCLSRHLDKLMPIIAEMLTSPLFPEDEVESFSQQSIQRLKLELTKHDTVAYRILTEHIFGSDHPYGYNSTEETYKALTRDALLQHFRAHFLAGNARIFLSGKPGPDSFSILDRHLGHALPPGSTTRPQIEPQPILKFREQVSLPQSVQASVRIGKRLFGQEHPDYAGFTVLNTLLGGYFGSRLMNNLREDKGLTYGIYSSIDPNLRDGSFNIGTDVDREQIDHALEEIEAEINNLCTEPVSEQELLRVKRYMLGNMLSGFDGPFAMGQSLKNLVINQLPHDFYHRLADSISHITAEQLQQLACTYLQTDTLYTVIID